MNKKERNIKIQETLRLGESLVFKEFIDSEFESYLKKVKNIIDSLTKTELDDIQLKTCELILNVKIEDFKYGFLKRLFTPYFVSGKLWIPRNTKTHIHQRYILNINSKLPILLN